MFSDGDPSPWSAEAYRAAADGAFIDCDDERLERRYTETRRPHPLAGDRPVTDGIRLERRVVAPLLDCAHFVIDTSLLTAADLQRLLIHRDLQPRAGPAPTLPSDTAAAIG